MNSTSTYRRSLIPFALACLLLLSGCAGYVTIPKSGRLADVHEAYPDAASMVPPADKRNAYERLILQAPHAVVYRAALESASGIMQIVSNDKERGVILGTTNAPSYRTAGNSSDAGMKRGTYYFAVRLSEKGPKRTEVMIMAKAQAECTYLNPTGWGSVGTAGILIPFAIMEKSDCIGVSQVRWLGEHEGDLSVALRDRTPLTRFVTAVRAKVIKAGYE